MKIVNRIAISIVWLYVNAISAQQLRFKQITSEEGLSTNFVKSIIQDDKGFMWFGTQDGLNKYDGYQLKVFKNDPTDSASIFCSDVTVLCQVKENLILTGTQEGLSFFNPMTEKFKPIFSSDEKFNCRVNAILKVNDELVMVGTDKGLFELNCTTKKIQKSYFTKEEVNIRCLENINGIVHIGTNDRGLWRIDANNAKKVEIVIPEYSEYKASDLLSITHISKYGEKIYLSTYGHGIYKVDKYYEIEKNIVFKEEIKNANYIRDFEVRSGRLYIASVNGLVVYNLLSEEVNLYTKQENALSINSNNCHCIFLDDQNNFWIGTEVGGVNISFFRSLKFPTSTLNYESKFENIFSFYEDKKGTVIIGGLNVLQEINLQNGNSISHQQVLNESGSALCITKESENIFWIGSYGNGLYRYEKSTKRSKSFLNSDFGGTIVCLKIDGNYLYAGSIGDGLFRINLNTFEVQNFTKADGLPSNSINTIFKDSKGKVWLGTYDGGLVRMNGFEKNGKLPIDKVFENKGKLGQIASNNVYGVNEDKRGSIWVATSTGLSKLLSNNTFYNFYEKDGLASTYLYSILKDSTDNFWMSSNSGIIKFDPKYSEKEITFKNYNVKDGLINTEYNSGAAFVSSSGMMYFGGAKGFNAFRPTAIKDNLHAPSAYVIGYQRGGSDVEVDSLITYKKYLELNWSENYFQFELVALDFTDPEKNKFKYKLEGYDDWSAPTSVRYVSYTALPGGDYTFKVKACNNDGIWNEQAFEINITVVPPFWKTKTFYILIILLGIGAIYTYTQYRTRAMKKENKILENKVALRTKQLEEKNKDITSSIEYAKRIQEAILPSKDTIFKKLKKVFILYQPKDIVSGDFYWFAEENGYKIFAVVDCTGHGVPGAFMSMIGHNLLHQIVLEKGITDPGDILNHLHKGVQEALRQGHNEISTNDGMDCSIIAINDSKKDIKWAGANRPLIVIDANREFIKFDGNKFPVGGAQMDHSRLFTTNQIKLEATSMAYMFSDGYADQFGGEKGKKFMVKRFHDLLSTIHLLPAEEQRLALKKNFEDWRVNHEQVDDVLIVGIEI